jgi:hypothetical protein
MDCDIVPEVPVMVTVEGEVVTAALEEAVNVSREPVVELAGANVAVTPPGNPEAVRVTAPVKEPTGVTVICVLAEAPGTTLSIGWNADKL